MASNGPEGNAGATRGANPGADRAPDPAANADAHARTSTAAAPGLDRSPGATQVTDGKQGWFASKFSACKQFLEQSDASWALVAFALLIVAGLIVLWTSPDCRDGPVDDRASRTTTILLLLWVAWIYAWVIHCFAGDPYMNRARTIKFAYFFVILSFVAVSIMIANIGRARSFGVVEGCVASTDDSSFLPIRCDHPLRLPQPQTYPVRSSAAPPEPPPGTGPANEDAAASKAREAAAAKAREAGTRTGDTTQGGATVAVSTPRAATFAERMDNAAINHNYHHLLNIGGRLDDIAPYFGEMHLNSCPAKMIHGGIPVPVYFVLLSLIGAAISLARHVPVIQRRSENEYVGTAAEPRLTPGQVRELLAFQILQFVSAPFLAVAAYHTIKPESLAITVALGFFTGFASERILTLLSGRFRDATEKNETSTVLAGSIQGDVKRGGKPEAGVTVEIDGLEKAKSVKTDASGRFKFTGVPVSTAPYRLVATLINTDGTFSGTWSGLVNEPKETPVGTIDLVKTS